MSTKTQQRLARQERAKAMRDAERKSAQRKRSFMIGGIVTVVILLVVALGIGISASRSNNGGKIVVPVASSLLGADYAKTGTFVGKNTAPVTMDAYEDFHCSVCDQFESQVGTTVTKMIADGTLRVRYHMLTIIDANIGGNYSARSANAFAAAVTYGGANANGVSRAGAFHAALYKNYPPESNVNGLTNAKMIQLAKSVGITSQQFIDAVNGDTYKGWVNKTTDNSSKAKVTGTPTFFVNGKLTENSAFASGSDFSPTAFTSVINAAAK
jgi:protein-disulfide isomerase